MSALLQTQPWWYWAIYATLVVAVIVTFWFAFWWISMETAKITRRIDLVEQDPDERFARFCWTHLRTSEAILAHTLAMARAVREHPERIEALLAENPVRLHVVDEVPA